MKLLTIFLAFLLSCGDQAADSPEAKDPKRTKVEDLQDQVLALQGTIAEINDMVLSNFSSCSGTDAADALIKKICKVAQAATVESKVEMKNELQNFANTMNEKLEYLSGDIAEILDTIDALDGVDISQLVSDVSTAKSDITSLKSRMTNAETAITALENLTNSINGTLNGTVSEVQIGNENLAAGPIYESLLKRTDGKKITGYIEVHSASVTIASDGLAVTNASSTLTYTTSAAHGLVVGNRVLISGVKKGKGWSSSEINGEFTVATVADTTHFTITASRNSTKTSTGFGGTAGTTEKVEGRGLGLIWDTDDDNSDVAVRVANPRGTSYNFIIVESGTVGFICYDKTDADANFATLSNVACQTAGVATGDCVCK